MGKNRNAILFSIFHFSLRMSRINKTLRVISEEIVRSPGTGKSVRDSPASSTVRPPLAGAALSLIPAPVPERL